MTIKLRPYQERDVDAIREAYRMGHKRVVYVLPTGGGKSRVLSYVAAGVARNGKRVLIVAHRRRLVRQLSGSLKDAGVRHVVMAAGYHGIPTCPVVVASAQTIGRRLHRFPEPDLIIIDEAHHVAPKNMWHKILAHFPNARALGPTATPARTDGTGMGETFSAMVVGPQPAELIEQGYLSNFEVYAPPAPDLSGLRKRGDDYSVEDMDKMVGETRITGDAVAQYLKTTPGEKGIAFCVNVKWARETAKMFNESGVKAESVDGSMEETEIEAVFARLESGETTIICTCDLVSEGVDLPDLVVAIMLRPTKSIVVFRQQVGRVLRAFPGKRMAYILDHVNNVRVHGFPDDEIEWTLDGDNGRRKKKSASGGEPESVRTCPKCFAAHRPTPTCPKCGHVYESKARTVKVVEGELKKMERGERGESGEKDWQRQYYALVGKGKKMGVSNPKIWAFNIVCSQESKRLAGKRDVIGKPTMNGLTMDERETIKRAVGL